MHVQIAPDVRARHQRRKRPLDRRPDLVVAVSNLRRDERKTDAGVDLFLRGGGREEIDLPLAREMLQALDVLDRAGEMKQGGSGAGRLRKSKADLHAVKQEVQTALAPVEHAPGVRQMGHVLDGARRIGGGRHDFQVADRVLPASERSGRQGPIDAGKRAQPLEDRIDDGDRTAEGHAGDGLAKRRQGGGDGGRDGVVQPGNRLNGRAVDGGPQIGRAGGAERLVNGGKLRNSDGPRLEQPPQVCRQIGNGRLHEHPRAGVVHVLEALAQMRVALERHRRIDQRSQIDVRLDAARSDECRTLLEHRRLASVTANRGEQGQLVERLIEGNA